MDLCNPSEIKELLSRHGFRFSKSMGQNFLIAGHVPEQIAEMSNLDEKTGVLEIGPGIGALTSRLARYAGKVVSVELDKALPPVLKETLADYDNVEIISGDILKTDIQTLVRDKFQGLRPVVCANLPYNITTPVLSALMESEAFDTITVMIQKEVAARITSKPGSSAYGSFTVYVNYYTEPELLFEVPPSCFMPQPKVTSAVIKLTRRKEKPPEVVDEKLFFRAVRGSFAQRRKTIVNGLDAVFPLSKEELTEIIVQLGHDPRIRGERLSIAEFGAIAQKIGERMSNETT